MSSKYKKKQKTVYTNIFGNILFPFYFFRFTGSVKLKGIIVIGEEDTHPNKMRL